MSAWYRLLDREKAAAVEHDRLSRVARYVDDTGAESIHVLYWNGQIVQSLIDSEWIATRGPLPIDPTQAQSNAAVLAIEQAAQQAQTSALQFRTLQLRTLITNTAQSAVGSIIDDLTAAQVKELLIVLLWKNGALDSNRVVKPLSEWT